MINKMKDFVVEVFLDVVVLWKSFPMVLISPQSEFGASSYDFLKIKLEIWKIASRGEVSTPPEKVSAPSIQSGQKGCRLSTPPLEVSTPPCAELRKSSGNPPKFPPKWS